MNDVSLIEEYSKDIENYIVMINQITYDVVSDNINNLEDTILNYLHNKFSNMSVSRNEIHSIVMKIYQTKNFNLKKEVECNLGKTKFDSEDKDQDVKVLIAEEVEKLKKLFLSVKIGTNYYYLGLVNDCTQEIIALLIRWHNSISFSKESEKAKNDIKLFVGDNYKTIMNDMGQNLLLNIYEPLCKKYLKEKDATYKK